MEEIYVVKVRTEPDPARLYPSERRYSALTVGGLGAVHLLLAATSLLLGGLGLALQSDSCWTGRYGGGLWLGLAAAAAGAAGILAWRRWYVDNNIRWFFICSTVAATTSLLCLVITAAVLAAIQEQRSNQELYRSIYYDQGFIHQQQQPVEINSIKELPSLNLQGSQQNDSHLQETRVHTEENSKLPHTFYHFAVINQHPSQKLKDNPEQATTTTRILDYSQAEFHRKPSEHSNSENEESGGHEIQTETGPGNSIQKPDLSVDDTMNISADTSADQDSEVWNQKGAMLGIKNAEYARNGDGLNSTVEQNHSKTDSESLQSIDVRNKTRGESVHIMRISKIKTNKTDYVVNKTLNKHDPPTNTNSDQFNQPKKSANDYQKEDQVENNDGHQRRVFTEDEHISPKIFSNYDTQDIMTVPSIKYETRDEENVTDIIHNSDDSNQTLSEFLSSKQSSKQEQPQYKLPRSTREVRTVVAINILVASALELAWSLLSANIAWKGMRNCYPHENSSNNCERTVEGLERLPPPPPPSSNDTRISNKRTHKVDGIFRKPDIISNHRNCHLENSFHLTSVQNKNGINRLHMINTVSERINTEPYLPMEESTMEYQERVHRFLASNSVANNASDSASNFDS
ncbi:hypothetical protein B7P43_G07889 [Cryptotermes secundus]|uniref:Uncharacterized protein n=1 Tax=Cryptotermes secundus TaxID=105785 RepID=A0A2J7QJE1_9NEOP|nr:uncharacterized protein LOC111867168 [Cryptotermes secundus]XP_023712532.1 uncharacterized protein LOC111867168 [Cryptotermes secundus]XP_033608468.1 uncharacterized protein LOC111867168 [Cryptotermes secundus]PNF28685.1 hypothetical protein B7P43_G07889 [Cryptotermes secundus]PNF28686.1 hypothetical protein B7P43_G07889 [Cryptotermes secundus]PNF28687.1 hypothetical protein B7P43_G07889 [Cryptotermes secundus]PNF28688.1 hypothetical protein B7P43_G07889 [Cryptotermes secundus]